MSRTTPLNGLLTHPLKPASIAVLRDLSGRDVVSFEINAGVRDRLYREGLAEEVDGRWNGKPYKHYRITDAGRARLAEIDAAKKGGDA